MALEGERGGGALCLASSEKQASLPHEHNSRYGWGRGDLLEGVLTLCLKLCKGELWKCG